MYVDAVFEILQTLREIGQKQTEQAARQTEEQAKSQTLTDQERAELEAKKEEIARIERSTAMNAERTASELGLLSDCPAPHVLTTLFFAEINELVAQLAQRTDKTDALLSEIAKNVKDGKNTKMDPALSNEVKKLLGYGFSATSRFVCRADTVLPLQWSTKRSRSPCQRFQRQTYFGGESFLCSSLSIVENSRLSPSTGSTHVQRSALTVSVCSRIQLTESLGVRRLESFETRRKRCNLRLLN